MGFSFSPQWGSHIRGAHVDDDICLLKVYPGAYR
jgi:hypothetical protein